MKKYPDGLTQLQYLEREGLLGSMMDWTWNGQIQICCGSKKYYYHKRGCKACTTGMNDELKDLWEQEQAERNQLRAVATSQEGGKIEGTAELTDCQQANGKNHQTKEDGTAGEAATASGQEDTICQDHQSQDKPVQ